MKLAGRGVTDAVVVEHMDSPGEKTTPIVTLEPADLGQSDTLMLLDDDEAHITERLHVRAGDTLFSERYQEAGVLGEGGMGVVKLYRDKRIGRAVAVKELHPELASHEHAQARFVREVRLQGQLEHPAIVPVYDLGMNAEGGTYFSMKRVRGVTLEEILAGSRSGDSDIQQRFGLRKLLGAFASVCLAVQFTHERGVFHRDLKPANIMLGDFGEVYVLDWGIAKVRAQRTREHSNLSVDASLAESATTLPGAIIGTPGYIAPELVLGGAEDAGPRSDVYALGTVLFEILTLERLHDVDSANALVGALVTQRDVSPARRATTRDIPPELDAICIRACAFDAAERYASARALQQAIDGYLEGERDFTLRAELASRHASAARQAAERAQTDDASLGQRRRAMQEIGRALALDPGNVEAMDIFEALLSEPPPVLPPEVQAEMRRTSGGHHRRTARIGAVAYASMILYLPLIAPMGIREAVPLWALYGFALLCVIISLYAMRLKRPSTGWILAVMLFSNLMYACTWPVFGPLVMLPTIVVANTVSFAIHLHRVPRLLAIATGCLTIAVPVILEYVGVAAPSYEFNGDTMIVHAGMVNLGQWSMVFLTAVSLAALVTGAMVVSRVRDALHEAELRLYTYTWHLREFVPHAARAPTDPTVARRAPNPE